MRHFKSMLCAAVLALGPQALVAQTNTCAGQQFEMVKTGSWQHGGRFCLGSTRHAFSAGGNFLLHSTNGNVVVKFSAAPNGDWIRSGTIQDVPNPRLNTRFNAMVFIGSQQIVFRDVTASRDLPGSFH